MANRVYETREITLQDDTDVTLKPLAIGRLRRFMEAWGKISQLEEDDDGFNVFINCSGIALEQNFKGQFDSLRSSKEEYEKNDEFLSDEYRDYLLDTLDLETIYEILFVSGGIDLRDPKLREQAANLVMEEDGKISTS